MLSHAEQRAFPALQKTVTEYDPDAALDYDGTDVTLHIGPNVTSRSEAHLLHLVSNTVRAYKLDRTHTPHPVAVPPTAEFYASWAATHPEYAEALNRVGGTL